jgi:DNA/RNA endonuclease YhcR with UshA esterase domain
MRLLTKARGCLLFLWLTLPLIALAQDSITPAQAAEHLGEDATVCGIVASATYAQRSRRTPTFLNLDRPYPHHIFTIVIWGDNRAKFSTPPESLRGARICVSGAILFYRGKPEIIVSEPSQISRSR